MQSKLINLKSSVCMLAMFAPLSLSAEGIQEYTIDVTDVETTYDNVDSYARYLSAGGTSTIVEVNSFSNDYSDFSFDGSGWYNFLTGEFRPFDLDAMQYAAVDDSFVHVSGLLDDNRVLMNWHDNGRYNGGAYDYSDTSPDSMMGIANASGTEIEWLDFATTKDGRYLGGANSYLAGNTRAETFIPVNLRYYDEDVCVADSNDANCSLQQAVVWNIETNTLAAEIDSTTSGAIYNYVRWVDTSTGELAYGETSDCSSGSCEQSIFKWTSADTSLTTVVEVPSTKDYKNIFLADVTEDGSLLVGSMEIYDSSAGYSRGEGFVYDDADGSLALVEPDSGFNSLFFSRIYDADEGVILGSQYGSSGGEALVYSNTGKETLNSFFELSSDYNFTNVREVNDDRSVLLVTACPDGGCTGPGQETYYLIGAPRAEAIGGDVVDLEVVSAQVQEVQSTISQASTSIMTAANGAHSNPLSRKLEVGQKSVWVTGDLAKADHYDDNSDAEIGAVSFGYNYGPGQFNISVGKVLSKQDLVSGGRAKSNGSYVNLDYIVPSNIAPNVFLTYGAFLYRGAMDTSRAFDNNGTMATASGSNDVDAVNLSVRLDAIDYINVGSAGTISAFAEYSYNKTSAAAYTETGTSSFNASYAAQEFGNKEIRLGGYYKHLINDRMNVVSNLELVRRSDFQNDNKSGELAGIEFDLANLERKQTWAKYGLGFDYSFDDDKAVDVTLYGTTTGAGASNWLSMTYKVDF